MTCLEISGNNEVPVSQSAMFVQTIRCTTCTSLIFCRWGDNQRPNFGRETLNLSPLFYKEKVYVYVSTQRMIKSSPWSHTCIATFFQRRIISFGRIGVFFFIFLGNVPFTRKLDYIALTSFFMFPFLLIIPTAFCPLLPLGNMIYRTLELSSKPRL